MLSREAAFLFNNLLLVGIAFSVLWGTLFPILSEAVRGTKITVGPPFFNRVNVPLGLLLLALTGIGPLIAWRKASPANLRRQFIAPVATGSRDRSSCCSWPGCATCYAVMALALAGFVAGTIAAGVLPRRPGPAADARRIHSDGVRPADRAQPPALRRLHRTCGRPDLLRGLRRAWRSRCSGRPRSSRVTRSSSAARSGTPTAFTHVGISQYEALNRVVSAATVQVSVDGKPAGLLTSEKRQHVDSFKRPTFEPSTEVGIRSGLQEDLYLVFAGAVDGTEEAVYRFNINPLVWWVWFGGFVLAFGGIVTMWPGGGPTVTAPARRAQGGYGVSLVGAGKE